MIVSDSAASALPAQTRILRKSSLFNDLYHAKPSTDATLTVTLVAPIVVGDSNQDGEVTFADIPAFIAILQAG